MKAIILNKANNREEEKTGVLSSFPLLDFLMFLFFNENSSHKFSKERTNLYVEFNFSFSIEKWSNWFGGIVVPGYYISRCVSVITKTALFVITFNNPVFAPKLAKR
jgi:hypothetical protein